MKTKTIFLSLFFMLASLSLWAQEKYEYAMLKKVIGGVHLKTETGFENWPIEKKEDPEVLILKKLAEYTSQGWEMYTVTEYYIDGVGHYLTYHLRRKKN